MTSISTEFLKESVAALTQLASISVSPATRKSLWDLLTSINLHTLKRSSKEDAFGRDEAFVEMFRPLFQFLYYEYFRVDAKGIKHVPTRGRAMIVANHSGMLPYDGAMIHLALFNKHPTSRIVRFLVDDFAFRLPLLGNFLKRMGGVPASRENATDMLAKGELIAIFPEGVKGVGKLYDERYELRPFGHGGFVKLAMRTKTTIIPTAVIGAEEIHPIIAKSETLAAPLGIPYFPFTPTFPWLGMLGLVPLPAKLKIIFGKPVSFARAKISDAENEMLVKKKTEEIRHTIQTMLTKALSKRKSIWW